MFLTSTLFGFLQRATEGAPRSEWADLERSIADLPAIRWLGLEVRVVSGTAVECRLPEVRPEHGGGLESEALNGGILLAMTDAVTVVTGLLQFPRHRCGTLDLSVSFMRPVGPEAVRAVGRIVRTTTRLAFVRTEILDESGVCVQAQGVVARAGRRGGDATNGRGLRVPAIPAPRRPREP